MADEQETRRRGLVRGYATVVVRGRWVVLALVAVATVLVVRELPEKDERAQADRR